MFKTAPTNSSLNQKYFSLQRVPQISSVRLRRKTRPVAGPSELAMPTHTASVVTFGVLLLQPASNCGCPRLHAPVHVSGPAAPGVPHPCGEWRRCRLGAARPLILTV
jgi:hypothetical protein